jgi:hypothetical protein
MFTHIKDLFVGYLEKLTSKPEPVKARIYRQPKARVHRRWSQNDDMLLVLNHHNKRPFVRALKRTRAACSVRLVRLRANGIYSAMVRDSKPLDNTIK